MTSQLQNQIIQLNPNSVEEVRKEYNLDKPGMMEQAIDILHDWIQKQDHFVKKDFRRDYLERVIISTKGSVEKAKKRMDKVCTMRTMVPNLFEKCDAKNDFPNLIDWYITVTMPKITDDNYRIFVLKLNKKKITSSIFLEGYQYSVLNCEYLKLYDYAHGCQTICDVRDANILDVVSNVDFIAFRNIMTLYTEGYGLRMKGIYVLSNSTMIGAFVDVIKQFVSDKVGKRIVVCKTLEYLHEHVPKRFLPEDYGGEQKPIATLCKEWIEELSSENNVKFLKEMRDACTNENLRRSDQFNEEYLGMPGSFKMLSVD